jgi:hypothetical protein
VSNQQLHIKIGHVGEPNLHIIADAKMWLGFLTKERFIVWALLCGQIRFRGFLKLFVAFGKCFPE